VENGTKLANNTAQALDEIIEGITKVSDLIDEIAMATNEQSQGISQISQGLGQIDKVTQANTAAAEESAAASEQLKEQAARLNTMLNRFRLTHQNVKIDLGEEEEQAEEYDYEEDAVFGNGR